MPEEDEDEKYVEWELIWAKAAAKGDWWPCQKCEVPDGERYPNDLTQQIKLDVGEHCVYCFGSLNYAKIKSGMIAKFEKNFEQFSKECKKKSFVKAMEEVQRFRLGTFPGAPKPRPPGTKKPTVKKEEREKDRQQKKRKRAESESSSSSEDSDESDSDDSSSDDENKKRKPKPTSGTPVKKTVKDKDAATELPKKPVSAFNRFCNDQKDKTKEKYPDLTFSERRDKLSEAWAKMDGSDERKQYERAYDNDVEEWKKLCGEERKSEGGSSKIKKVMGGKDGQAGGTRGDEGDSKVRDDADRRALLQKLKSLDNTLSNAVEELAKLHKSQTRILNSLGHRPLPGTAEEKRKFLEDLKSSQVGKAVQRMKKHAVKDISNAANNLRCKWETLIAVQQVEASTAGDAWAIVKIEGSDDQAGSSVREEEVKEEVVGPDMSRRQSLKKEEVGPDNANVAVPKGQDDGAEATSWEGVSRGGEGEGGGGGDNDMKD